MLPFTFFFQFTLDMVIAYKYVSLTFMLRGKDYLWVLGLLKKKNVLEKQSHFAFFMILLKPYKNKIPTEYKLFSLIREKRVVISIQILEQNKIEFIEYVFAKRIFYNSYKNNNVFYYDYLNFELKETLSVFH